MNILYGLIIVVIVVEIVFQLFFSTNDNRVDLEEPQSVIIEKKVSNYKNGNENLKQNYLSDKQDEVEGKDELNHHNYDRNLKPRPINSENIEIIEKDENVEISKKEVSVQKNSEAEKEEEILRSKVEDAVGTDEIKPIYKKWHKVGGLKYNIFVKNKNQETFAPPSVPQFSKVKVGQKSVNIVLSPDKNSYLAIKKDDSNNEVEVKEIKVDKNNNTFLAPPQIGGN